MDLLKIVSGIILALVGGKGSWWMLATIFGGVASGNWLKVIAGGIIGYLAFGISVVFLIAGACLLLEGVFE